MVSQCQHGNNSGGGFVGALRSLFCRNPDPDLAARITAIEDRIAITDLIHCYTEFIRTRREMDVLELMVDDTTIEVRHANPDPTQSTLVFRYAGRDEIRLGFKQTAGASANVWPMIHNLRIDLDGDEARASSVMMSAIWPHGQEYVGEYRDTLRKVDGEWKFTSRSHSVFGDSTGRYSQEAHEAYVSAKSDIGDS